MVRLTYRSCEEFSPSCVVPTPGRRGPFFTFGFPPVMLTILVLLGALLSILAATGLCCTEAEHNRKKHIPLFGDKE